MNVALTKTVTNKLGNALGYTGLTLKRHTPEILAAVGVVGTVASVVLACKATTKVEEILDQTKEEVEQVHRVKDDEELSEQYNYTDEDVKKDLLMIYTKTGVKLVKLYAPAVILGTLSIGSMLMSNNILRKRNMALAAACATVDKGFKEYRSRVVERFGEEVDKELKYNIKAQKVEETVVDEKTGKEKKVKKEIKTVDGNHHSPYARFYDIGCRQWEDNAQLNYAFLRGTEEYFDLVYQTRGYLFLNEVYEYLKIPVTKASRAVGWDKRNPESDEHVRFGIFDVSRPEARDFVNGYEPVLLMDFNVVPIAMDQFPEI